MIPASVEVTIDEKAVREYIQHQIKDYTREAMLLIDIERLAEITSMSRRFLEDEILNDPRMKLLERRKSRKRWWFYQPSLEVIKEIVDEW